jgi:hypothetical protein
MTRHTVLYIGGTGRTGSTMVDQLLGQFDSYFSGGEMAFFWSRGIEAGAICACGEPVRTCSVWSHAVATITGDPDQLATQMVALRRRFWSPHVFAMPIPGFSRRRMREIAELPRTVERLYDDVIATRDVEVFIDSSKEPHYSYILREGSELDLRFLHLVRDPRAVGRSWQRRKTESGLTTNEIMEQRSSPMASAYYLFSNIVSELFWGSRTQQYAFLRYEDFVADPAGILESIGEFAGSPIDPSSVLDGSSFAIGQMHTSWGNPSRVGRTSITIRQDDAWRTELSRRDLVVLTVLNLPLLLRYGYPIRPSRPRRRTLRSGRLRRADLARRRGSVT